MDGKSALQIFAGKSVLPKATTFRPFGCPVYILDQRLQAGIKISKWHTRARVGLYLGHSPVHAKTVSLVLNITTGLVSPQFHLKFDKLFETVNQPGDNLIVEWKTKCHFVTPSNIPASQRSVSKGDPEQALNVKDIGQYLEYQLDMSEPPPKIPRELHHGEEEVPEVREANLECMEQGIPEKEPV